MTEPKLRNEELNFKSVSMLDADGKLGFSKFPLNRDQNSHGIIRNKGIKTYLIISRPALVLFMSDKLSLKISPGFVDYLPQSL